MRRFRALVASVLGVAVVGTTALVATPASTAGTPPLTITCSHSQCTATGQLGNLALGVVYAGSTLNGVALCLPNVPSCSGVSADLIVVPGGVIGGAGVGSTGVGAIVTTTYYIVKASAASETLLVEGTKSLGFIELYPGVHKCLEIHGLTITALPC